MRRTRNTNVIYTGTVGRKMPMRLSKPSRRIFWQHFTAVGGPLNGLTIRLDKHGDCRTLPIVLHGQCGMYNGPRWVPA